MKYMPNVLYLEQSDFDKGVLVSEVCEGKPCLVMMQSNSCHHCENAKPAFEELAKKTDVINVATIQVDEQRGAAQPIMEAVKAQGVPTFVVFDEQGVLVGQYTGGRDLASLEAFVNSVRGKGKKRTAKEIKEQEEERRGERREERREEERREEIRSQATREANYQRGDRELPTSGPAP